jgi:hypothetical protein
MPHIEIMKFCQNHWYLLRVLLVMESSVVDPDLAGSGKNNFESVEIEL